MEILQYIIFGLFGLLLIVQIYYRYVSEKQINSIVEDIFQKQGIVVDEISDLSTTERLKYGVPINNFIGSYGLIFSLFTKFGENHFRKVDTIDKDKNEQIRYIDLYIKKRKLVRYKEFDRYNF